MSDIESDNPTISASKGDSLIVIGFNYGAKAGFWLSIIYALTGMIVVTLAAGGFRAFPALVVLLAVGFVVIFFMAIAPAALYGLFTGIILGALIEKFKKRIPKYIYSVLSMMICLSIAVITHLLFGIRPALSFNSMASSGESFGLAPFDSYLFSIGFPTIIYIITGGWTGWKLYSKMLEKNG
jgi:hypothetical protein